LSNVIEIESLFRAKIRGLRKLSKSGESQN
jgi:hypothetical protein